MNFTLVIKKSDLEVSYETESLELALDAYKELVEENKEALVDITITLSNEESVMFTHHHKGVK